jgi:periplasmic divalent cation tolerance protein
MEAVQPRREWASRGYRGDQAMTSQDTGLRFVYVTTEKLDEAWRIGETLVRERLAACANVLPGMQSCYWWEGKLTQANESVLIMKTREALINPLTARVRELHSYSVPCVVALPVVGGNADYLAWIRRETGG